MGGSVWPEGYASNGTGPEGKHQCCPNLKRKVDCAVRRMSGVLCAGLLPSSDVLMHLVPLPVVVSTVVVLFFVS